MRLLPSDLNVLQVMPFVGVFGRAEAEQAAALIVRTCQVAGDKFRPIMPREVGSVLSSDIEEFRARSEHHPWDTPFFRPDADELVRRGHARWSGEPLRSELSFTAAGRYQLERSACRQQGHR